jgi:hypothetical protein
MSRTPGPRLELLVGMVASGKTTYARDRADHGALVVSHDDLTQMLHGRYRYEPDLKPTYRAMMRYAARHGLEEGRDVVIDRTNLTRESRRYWTGAAAVWGVPIVAVVFPRMGPASHAMRRFEADPRGRSYVEWLEVARHHADQAEAEPLDWEGEGFASVIHAGHDTEGGDAS